MPMTACTDRVVGDILSSWRYDISGITPEMRRDYEQHLVECSHCRKRQSLHRTIDMVLIGVSSVSIAAFLFGLAVIHHVQPLQHWALVDLHLGSMSIVLSLQAAAIAGLLFSLMIWVLVAVATPAPVYLAEVALAQARVLQDRIPEELRERLMRNVA
ncbi:MAG TPA: hypothetical protein VN828_19110 [Acidobacteriaceae bacterium]|nr:hypothetical protein [Acidobacteriaceae bacterium]